MEFLWVTHTQMLMPKKIEGDNGVAMVNKGHLRLTIGYHKATIVYFRVTLGHHNYRLP